MNIIFQHEEKKTASLKKIIAATIGLVAISSAMSTVLAQAIYEPYAITTFAGEPGQTGSADGGSDARFFYPSGAAVDNAGNVYVADQANHTIRKIAPGGEVSTLAGLANAAGSDDGVGSVARFNTPVGLAVDSAGNVYVADYNNSTIRKITPDEEVSTLAGLAGLTGSDDGVGSAARFYLPTGVAVDNAGNVYVADNENHTIRKISPGGEVSTLAGLAAFFGGDDGLGSAARFYRPSSVAVDNADNVYVADTFNHTIRKITPGGEVSTSAGLAGATGSADGAGSDARFAYPSGVVVDSAGSVYVADYANHTIRKINSGGEVRTLAGVAGLTGSDDGNGGAARLWEPNGVGISGSGNLYIADKSNHTIRAGVPAQPLALATAASRKVHDTAGSFDIDLPLSGEPGVECRNSGETHTLVFTFNDNVWSGAASVIAGTGSVTQPSSFVDNTMTVTLIGVADMQMITVSLNSVTDASYRVLPDTAVSVNMLIGDTTGNKTVNASDIGQTKGQSGAAVTSANFRSDINVNGTVAASDVAQVKANAGHTLP